jgi:hypothetical protein
MLPVLLNFPHVSPMVNKHLNFPFVIMVSILPPETEPDPVLAFPPVLQKINQSTVSFRKLRLVHGGSIKPAFYYVK